MPKIKKKEINRIATLKQDVETEHNKKLAALKAREDALDNRHHMHVRREQRERITKEIKDRLQDTIVTESAGRKRVLVFFMAIIIALFLGFSSYTSMENLNDLISPTDSNEPQYIKYPAILWFVIFKLTLSSLGTVASIVYAMSWLRGLYLEDVRTQKELERYAYDINRASWTIETIMEMQETKGTPPPNAWVDATCKNLFDSYPNEDVHVTHPIEALLKSSAKVELSPDGATFELGKKGAKNLAKEISK